MVPNPASGPTDQCGGGRGTKGEQGQQTQRNLRAGDLALALPLLGSVTLNESLIFLSLSPPLSGSSYQT